MKQLSLIFAFIFSFQIISSAQYGLSVAYKPIEAPNWEYIISQHKIYEPSSYRIEPLTQGIHFGIDYWFRLKKYRVEFLPEASITRVTRIWEKEGKNDQIRSNFFGLHFNTNFYLFDMKGDCNCPTFSKQGPDIAKGFFIQVSPGINLIANSYKEDDLSKNASDIAPSVGIGVGIDFGLSDFLTVTPMIKYHRYFNVEWEGLHDYFSTDQVLDASLDKNNIDQVFAGVRIGFRFDELKRY